MSRKKNNDYLARQQVQQAAVVDMAMQRTHIIVEAMCRDAAVVAANAAFGIGKGRMGKFLEEFEGALMWFAETQAMDTEQNGDPNWGYTKSKVDAVIKKLVPDDMYQPFEDRYGYAEDSIGRKSI